MSLVSDESLPERERDVLVHIGEPELDGDELKDRQGVIGISLRDVELYLLVTSLYTMESRLSLRCFFPRLTWGLIKWQGSRICAEVIIIGSESRSRFW